MPTSPMSPHARPERQAAAARLAVLTRDHGPDHPDVLAARRELHLARGLALAEAACVQLRAAVHPDAAASGDESEGGA